jgi:hypothetical protein
MIRTLQLQYVIARLRAMTSAPGDSTDQVNRQLKASLYVNFHAFRG